jgi:hypothetical protein
MLEPSEPPGAVAKRDILRRPAVVGTLETVDDELISRDELTATLFAIQDIRVAVRRIRDLLEDEDGEAGEDDT